MSIIGRVVAPSSAFNRTVTEEDALWLGRALVGEEGERASRAAHHAVASTLIRRWAFASRSYPRSFPTLTAMVRAYSQPVNPIWENRGDADAIARRARIRSLAWSQLPETVRGVVVALLTGAESLSARGAVHFADGPTSANFQRNNPSATVVPSAAANVLLAMPGSAAFDVYAEPASGGGGPSGILVACVVLLAVAIAWGASA